jgi:hypothetical protein
MAIHLPSFALLPCLALSVAAQQAPAAPTWWAYRPLSRPAVPAVAAAWAGQPIDAFVLAGLQSRGLLPAPPADRHTWLRRVTYDLTGLPPTTAEIDAYLADAAADAEVRVVDRLLASPQYGVKWAQHWLDLVRYAETDGYERDRQKPFVWRYRDWVVDAFNQDLPYGEFVLQQLAGDERPEPRVADLVATGFYRLGIWDDEPTDRLQHRYDDLDTIADTAARSFLAISMGCARCHDHKKDPLSQREYHGFLGYFENVRPYDLRATAVPVDGGAARFAAELAAWQGRREAAEAQLRGRAQAAWDELPTALRRERLERAEQALVARYDGDRGSATAVLDGIGGRHGTIDGQVVQVDGWRGPALRFDGDDHVVLPRLVQDSFSVAFAVRSSHQGAGRGSDRPWFQGTGLVDGEVPGIVADWGIAWHSDGYVVAGSGDPETFLASGPGHHDGQWHHVVFTRDRPSGRIALYVDGVLAEAATGSTKALDAPPRLVVGRAQPGGSGFRGDVDELQFYGRALTAAEVAALALRLPGGVGSGEDIAAAPALAALQANLRPGLATVEVLAVAEAGPTAPPAQLRLRGNVHAVGAAVDLGVPAMLGNAVSPPPPVPTPTSSGRRTALARWIVDPANPLTWRVIANRLWQHHFGRGLVRSSNDFGRLGEAPTHPELLDWLATELLARGQSLKAMHRLLVLSNTYRMASLPVPAAAVQDPLNDAFWRFDRRRLTAEEVRDSMLAVSGDLQLALGGPSVYPPLPAEVLATASRPEDAWGSSTPEQAARRSLFVHVKRSLPEPLLAVFDRADTDASCPVRFATVQPTQALTLLNGDFPNQQAARLAARLERAAGEVAAQLALGIALVTQRPADPAAIARLQRLHTELQQLHGRTAAEALQRCCLVLLNGNEFVFVD